MDPPFIKLTPSQSHDPSSASLSEDSGTASSTPPPGSTSASTPPANLTPELGPHNVARARYHAKDIEEFAKELEIAANRALPTCELPRYKRTKVLLLRWKEDELQVEWELEDLSRAFQSYGFDTETWLIPQSTWSCKRDINYSSFEWTGCQNLFEQSKSDALLLLDCCCGAAAAGCLPRLESSITETIAACGWETWAPEPGRHSFTNALITVLEDWVGRKSFSAAMLHSEVLSLLKQPRPRRNREISKTPVYIVTTSNPKKCSIEIARVTSVPQPPKLLEACPGLEQTPSQCSTNSPASLKRARNFENDTDEQQSKAPKIGDDEMEFLEGEKGKSSSLALTAPTSHDAFDLSSSLATLPDKNFVLPHVMLSIALESDQELDSTAFAQWMKDLPALAKYAKIQGVYRGYSTLILTAIPVFIWDLLPENFAYNFVGYTRSDNLLGAGQPIKAHKGKAPSTNQRIISPLPPSSFHREILEFQRLDDMEVEHSCDSSMPSSPQDSVFERRWTHNESSNTSICGDMTEWQFSGPSAPGAGANKDTFRSIQAEFSSRLPYKEQEEFKLIDLDNVRHTLLEIQEQQSKAKRLCNLNRVAPFLEAMSQYERVLEVTGVVSNASSILSSVWGPMNFCLSSTSSWPKAFNILLDAYQQLAENLPMLEQYESFFITGSETPIVLALIYEEVLKFHLAACKLFAMRAWKQSFDSMWKTFLPRFQHILDILHSYKVLVERAANAAEIKARQVENSRLRVSLAATEHAQITNKLLSVMNWLNPADAILDQEAASLVRQENPLTGQRILQESKVKGWIKWDNTTVHSLWLTGIPGAGKTILASLIVEELLRLESDQQHVLFFYCRHQNPQRSNFVDIARSLLTQILSKKNDVLPYFYNQYLCSGQLQLVSSEMCKELLEICFSKIPRAYVIIDGIDECDLSERKAILHFFTSLVEGDTAQGRLKALFVSRDEPDIRKLVKGASIVQLNEVQSRGDIETYTAQWVDRIMEKFGLHDDSRTYIKSAICDRSEGMFLFAKLVLQNLYSQVSRDGLYRVFQVNTLPKGLSQVYSRIVARIYDNPNLRERDIAKKLIGLIVCAKRPLKWHEIQAVMSIDTDLCSIDFETRSLRASILDFCGSLIEILPGERVQIVHQSARSYLIDENYVHMDIEEGRLAIMCLRYMTSDCFDQDISPEERKEYVSNGYYAFQDYAVVHWVDHLWALLSSPDGSPDLDDDLASSANDFCEMHNLGPLVNYEVQDKLRGEFRKIKDSKYAEKMLLLLSLAKQARSTDEPLTAFDDLDETIRQSRSVLEEMSRSMAQNSKEKLQQYYGNNWYKCPHYTCFYFHEGFLDSTSRDNHVTRHERPLCCTERDCPGSAMQGVEEM